MTEIQEMPDPKATTVIPDSCIWVCLYWIQGVSWPQTMYSKDKAEAIKYAVENVYRDLDKSIKLYRLDY